MRRRGLKGAEGEGLMGRGFYLRTFLGSGFGGAGGAGGGGEAGIGTEDAGEGLARTGGKSAEEGGVETETLGTVEKEGRWEHWCGNRSNNLFSS